MNRMNRVLTSFTPDQQVLFEAALANEAEAISRGLPAEPILLLSVHSRIAMLDLVHQGLFMANGRGWSLTNRGRLVATGVQHQGQIASGGLR